MHYPAIQHLCALVIELSTISLLCLITKGHQGQRLLGMQAMCQEFAQQMSQARLFGLVECLM